MQNKRKEEIKVVLNGEDITERCAICQSGNFLSVCIKSKAQKILVSKEYVIDGSQYVLNKKNKEDK